LELRGQPRRCRAHTSEFQGAILDGGSPLSLSVCYRCAMKKVWLATVLIACSGPAPASNEGEGGGEGEETSGGEGTHRQSARELIGIHPPEVPWSTMSHADREMDMVGRFLPIMAEVFREHDSEEFAHFGCESCHGDDMRERNFAMPSPHLPPVPLAGTPGYAQMQASEGEMVRFMEEGVNPPMQTMLGMGATFTCNGCHPLPQ
jgi:hypothetical protein